MSERVNIICLYWEGDFRGRDYTPDDVRRLRETVDRHIDRDYDFYVLTNTHHAFPGRSIQLLNNWPGWWSKVELFRNDLPPGRTLYLDLDTHIVNSLQPILDFKGNLVMFPTPYKKGLPPKVEFRRNGIVRKYQAGTMLFDPGALAWVYGKFMTNPEKWMKKYRSEQDMYGMWIPDQPVFPGSWMRKIGQLKHDWVLEDVIVVTGRPSTTDFRDPKFAPWLKERAR